jgi:DNA replication and repair protein RecF
MACVEKQGPGKGIAARHFLSMVGADKTKFASGPIFLHHEGAVVKSIAVYTLSVQSFRCYAHVRKSVEASPLFITGPNGIGKTSFLEALSLFTPGRGLRSAVSGDLKKHDAPGPWRLALHLDSVTGPMVLETGIQDGCRRVWANGVMLKSHTLMRQWVNVVWPMVISADTPSQRRSYLNRMTFTLDVDYGALWLRYEKALRQRNALLQEGTRNGLWYDALEAILGENAVLLFEKRRNALVRIEQAMGQHCTPFPVPRCVMLGAAETSLEGDPTGVHYLSSLRASRPLDFMKKTTSFGLHKTRFECIHPHGREWGLCSAGEQKGLLLSLALAVFRTCMTLQPHGAHFLLMDEGMVHLDQDRQNWLWQELAQLGGYVVVTGIAQETPIPDQVTLWSMGQEMGH